MRTMEDPEFLGEAEAAQLEINPVTGEQIEKLVIELYRTSRPIAAKAAEFIRR